MPFGVIGKVLIKRYQSDLISFLQIFDGLSDLVLEKELGLFLDLIASIKLLKSHEIDKIFYLEPEMNVGNENRIYLIRPLPINIKYISKHIIYDRENRLNRRYLILILPQKTLLVNELLETYGMLDNVKLCEWHVELVPLDSDLFSLERNYIMSNYLDSNYCTISYLVASSLYTLFEINNWNVVNIHCLGELANRMFDVFKFLWLVKPPKIVRHASSMFTDLILVDRRIDLVSPILTQLTYEGLLDDNFGVSYSCVTLNEKVTGKTKSIRLLLNSKDPTYDKLRGYHISLVFSYIKDELRNLIYRYEQGRQQSTISEMKAFVGELKTLKPMEQSLVAHLCVCEYLKSTQSSSLSQRLLSLEQLLVRMEPIDDKEVIKFFEEIICIQCNWRDIVRLFCLYSMLGMSSSRERRQVLTYLQKIFLRAHGNEHINTFNTLTKLGMLNPQDQYSKNFQSAINKLNLNSNLNKQDFNLITPKDISFVYGGHYKPMICKLLEIFFKEDAWQLGAELLDKIKIKCFRESFHHGEHISNHLKDDPRRYLVYFIGGCSYSEINAIRFLGKKFSICIGIATTKLLNRNSLFETMKDDVV